MSWLSILGKSDKVIEDGISGRVNHKYQSGKYSDSEVMRVMKLSMFPFSGDLKVSDETLEKIRRLCQVWDVDLRARWIRSHRKWLGPFIVIFKRITFPIARLLLKDFIRQQRDFNAASISLMCELAAKSESKSSEKLNS